MIADRCKTGEIVEKIVLFTIIYTNPNRMFKKVYNSCSNRLIEAIPVQAEGI